MTSQTFVSDSVALLMSLLVTLPTYVLPFGRSVCLYPPFSDSLALSEPLCVPPSFPGA